MLVQVTSSWLFLDSSTAGNRLALGASGCYGGRSLWGALSGGIELTGDYGAQTLSLSGEHHQGLHDQTGAIT